MLCDFFWVIPRRLNFICRRFGTLYLFHLHGSPRHAPYLLHIPVRGLYVGRYPPQPISVLRPATNLSPSFPLAQALFEPNIFPYKFSNIFKPSQLSYLSAYEDGTVCSETSAYKIQTPGNYPEKGI